MRRISSAASLLGLLLLTLFVSLGPAGKVANAQSGFRQYYGNWKLHSTGYYYRSYYYKPAPSYTTYRQHYCVYYPSRPTYYYYYNPYTKMYWGRCSVKRDQELYSLLKDGDRKSSLDDIPESAFPEPAAPPPIPESSDGETMILGPADLPEEATAPR